MVSAEEKQAPQNAAFVFLRSPTKDPPALAGSGARSAGVLSGPSNEGQQVRIHLMNQKYTYYLRYACVSGVLAAALALGGCSLSGTGAAVQNEPQNRQKQMPQMDRRSQTEPMRP